MFFYVDQDRCKKDGICIEECPARILEMGRQGPRMVAAGEKGCIRCGHCVAVCPEAALRLEGIAPDDCKVIDAALQVSFEQADQFLRSRRSIRTYQKKPVDKEIIEKAITLASAAPTGGNRQPVNWLVLYDRKGVEIVAAHVVDWMNSVVENKPEIAAGYNMQSLLEDGARGIDRICRDAPHLIFVHASKEFGIAPVDCATALAYLELALPPLGAGSCWAGYVYFAATQWPPLADFLALPDEHRLHGALMLGYPKFSYRRIPPRNKPQIVFR